MVLTWVFEKEKDMLEAADLSQLKNIFRRGDGDLQALYFPDLEEVKTAIQNLKAMGCSVVMTSGVYDMVHDGHIKYLRKARSFGDVLVLAIDTDERVKQRKGPRRPVAELDERLHVLSDFRFVDILTLVEINDDPAYVLKALRPDVFVISATTQEMTTDVVQSLEPYCGKIELLPPQSANSTTARLRQLMIEGSIDVLKEAEDNVEKARLAISQIREKLLKEQNNLSHSEAVPVPTKE